MPHEHHIGSSVSAQTGTQQVLPPGGAACEMPQHAGPRGAAVVTVGTAAIPAQLGWANSMACPLAQHLRPEIDLERCQGQVERVGKKL